MFSDSTVPDTPQFCDTKILPVRVRLAYQRYTLSDTCDQSSESRVVYHTVSAFSSETRPGSGRDDMTDLAYHWRLALHNSWMTRNVSVP